MKPPPPVLLVDCEHCGKRHSVMLWHNPWCPRCRLHVRTCERVRPRIETPPHQNIAPCGDCVPFLPLREIA